MLPRVCYLGDDNLSGAAVYLAGIMTHARLAFDHVPSTETPPESFMAEPYALYVVSDYPAARFRPEQLACLVQNVQTGSGLAMFGGWESFHGRLGEYHRSALAEALPVTMLDEDDRHNCAQPCLIEKAADHPILEGLPLDSPPGISGLNRIRPKSGATTVLTAVEFNVKRAGGDWTFTPVERHPLLILGQWGKGRVAALATDVAPHWVGGLVDWGNQRVSVDLPGGFFIEVGSWYVRLFENLLNWTGGEGLGMGGVPRSRSV